MNDPASSWSSVSETHDHTITTPEQVDLHLPLAGLGSRFLAVLIDFLIQGAANIVLVIIVAIAYNVPAAQQQVNGMSGTAAKWFAAIVIIVYFCLYWGYFSLFEAFRNGQTPGKRVLKIRVIKDSGRQITFFEALARNLLRALDWLPGIYLVGTISILLTRQNKRLGDLLADTIVVHERTDDAFGYAAPAFVAGSAAGVHAPAESQLGGIPADRIARLRAADLHLIESYLSRALALPIETRGRLASRLLDGLCAKMNVAVPANQSPERTLEAIAYVMRAHGAR